MARQYLAQPNLSPVHLFLHGFFSTKKLFSFSFQQKRRRRRKKLYIFFPFFYVKETLKINYQNKKQILFIHYPLLCSGV